MGVPQKIHKAENVTTVFAAKKTAHGVKQRRLSSARRVAVTGMVLSLFAVLAVQGSSSPSEKCVIEALKVEVASATMSPVDDTVTINVKVDTVNVVPSEPSTPSVELVVSCRSGGNLGTTSKLAPTTVRQHTFDCVVRVDALCSRGNVVVTATARTPDVPFSLKCEQHAQATTTVCRENGGGGLPPSPSLAPCPIETLDLGTPTVRSDTKSLYDVTIEVEAQLVNSTALNEVLRPIKLKNYCIFNDHPGKISPATRVGQNVRFECTVWTEYPFDCGGNLLDLGIEAYVRGASGIPTDGCAVNKSMLVAICLDRSSGQGIVTQPGGFALQQPQLAQAFPPPLECRTELPSVQLLQIQSDHLNQFKATLDVVSKFSGTRHGLVEAIHLCSINGRRGVVEDHYGHGGESLFSCTVETTWPFHCGSNFIEFWTQVTDRRQSPPCVKNTGQRFSYCLDPRTRATHVLGLQAIQFPTVRDTSFFGFRPGVGSAAVQLTQRTEQCPITPLHVELGQASLNSTNNEQRFVLELIVNGPDASSMTITCTLNGTPGVTSQPTQSSRGSTFTCTVKPWHPSECRGNMVDVWVQTSKQNSAGATCKQDGSVRVSICLNDLLNGVRVAEVLEVPESSFGRSKFPHLGDNYWDFHSEPRSFRHYGRESFGDRLNKENKNWKGVDLGWGRRSNSRENKWRSDERTPFDHNAYNHSRKYWQEGRYTTSRDCAFDEGGWDITIQQARRDPSEVHVVILDIVLLRQEIDDKSEAPYFDCSLNEHRGSLSPPIREEVGFLYVCRLHSLNPFQCGSNTIVLIGDSSDNGRLGNNCTPRKRKIYTFCLDSKTEEVKISELSEENPSRHKSKLRSKGWGVPDPRGWSSDQGCAVRGELAVDLLGSVWDGRSKRATLRLLIRYGQGAEPSRVIQDELLDVHCACSLHGKLGIVSPLYADPEGLGATCTLALDWPMECGANWIDVHVEIHEKTISSRYSSYTRFTGFRTERSFAERNAACDKQAARLVSLCVDPDTQRALVLVSKIIHFREKLKGNACLVSELETEITKVEEKHQAGFLPLLTTHISVRLAFRQTKYRDWRNIHIQDLDPIRDIKCACQSNGVRGETGGIAATPNGFQFTCTVPLHDKFNCLTLDITSITYLSESFASAAGGHECSKTYSLMATSYCTQPACRFFAVDMGYSGQFGLATDAPTARILLLCSHPVEVCKECFVVSGPQFASVDHLQLGNDGLTTYYVYFSWEDTYRGPVSISIEPARSRPGCSLDLLGVESVLAIHPSCTRERVATVGVVKDLRFNVVNRGQVLVKTIGYETMNGCNDRC